LPNTPILGLAIPVGGTTPGAANNITAGTYPFMWAGNLNIIDSGVFSPGNPVPTATPGLNINSNVNFNGFGITNASTAVFSGNVGISGLLTLSGAGTALSVTNNATVIGTLTVGTLSTTNLALSGTLGVGGTSTFGTNFANTIAIAGKATGTDPTITVAGDATRNLNIITALASGTTIGGLYISPSGGVPTLIGSAAGVASGASAIWLGSGSTSPTNTNFAIFGIPTVTSLNVASGGTIAFDINASSIVQITTSSFGLQTNIPIQQNTAATALTIKGNSAATGGIANILDNQTTQTSGTITSFRTGGTEKAGVTFAGGFFSDTGTFTSGTVGTGIGLGSQAASGGDLLTVFPASVDVGGTGTLLKLQSLAGTNQFAITGRGHMIPLSTAPTAPISAAFNAGYTATAAVNTISTNGSDASFQLKFTVAGIPTAIAAGSVLVQISLAQSYSSTSVTGMACYGKTGNGVSDTVALYVVQNAVGTIQICNVTSFTPVIGSYVFNVVTIGAGATS
jgi:hypothetical protein